MYSAYSCFTEDASLYGQIIQEKKVIYAKNKPLFIMLTSEDRT